MARRPRGTKKQRRLLNKLGVNPSKRWTIGETGAVIGAALKDQAEGRELAEAINYRRAKRSRGAWW